jgi:CheY-like chemotaxis protein
MKVSGGVQHGTVHVFDARSEIGTAKAESLERPRLEGTQGTEVRARPSSPPGGEARSQFDILVTTAERHAVCFDILVADDRPEVAAMMARLLGRWGHRVRSAASAGRALELVRVAPADVAFVRERLPDMDGAELATALRACSAAVRLVALSDRRPSSIAAAAEASFAAVLRVPVEIDTIAAMLLSFRTPRYTPTTG